MATAATSRFSEALDTSVRLVTPERISFHYPLAGPFPRALAYLIDLLVWSLLTAVLFLVGLLLGATSGVGLALVACFVLQWGYGAAFEALWNGQTPGKRLMGLRVVTAQGTPIAGFQALVRNVTWAVEGPLALAFMPALASMLLSSRFQRLGDLAAGTMVIVERRPTRGKVMLLDEPEVDRLLQLLPARIEAGREMAQALADYVKHRARFGRARREEMTRHVAHVLRRRYELPPEASGDAIVCALHQRIFVGA